MAITVTPPASASEHSPRLSPCTARCIATSEDEHAVSTAIEGPSSPKVYDTRPGSTLAALDTMRMPSTASGTAPLVNRSE